MHFTYFVKLTMQTKEINQTSTSTSFVMLTMQRKKISQPVASFVKPTLEAPSAAQIAKIQHIFLI